MHKYLHLYTLNHVSHFSPPKILGEGQKRKGVTSLQRLFREWNGG